MTRRQLLAVFTAAYPAQPATALWRAIEMDAIARHGFPSGLGLDLGCGDGILTDLLLRLLGERRLVGVDPDPQETAAAQRFPFYVRVHTCPGDAIPEADGTFDFVLANSVLEHIPALDDTIREVSRVLRPGGRFLFTVPSPNFHSNLRGSLIPHVRRQAYLSMIDRRLAHHHYLSSEQWTMLCRRHGLLLEDCLGYLDKSETRRWESLSRVTGGLLYSLFGKTSRPIEIQRRLRLRQTQNRRGLPAPIARLLAGLAGARLRMDDFPRWVDLAEASCFLLAGRRV